MPKNDGLIGASCAVSAGGTAIIIPPRNLTIATAPGALPALIAKCTAVVGGSSLSETMTLSSTSGDSTDSYDSGLDANFRRARTR